MKAVFISYNQAHTLQVNAALDKLGVRGFTRWALTEGRGSTEGEPHYGTHAWPSMNSSLLIFMDDGGVEPLLEALRELDAGAPQQGLRAFVMNAEAGM
jgi:nitrogen regulatory protein PII